MTFLSQQLKLNVIWLESTLGFAIDRYPGQASYPLTSYYLWPRVDAWEQLKIELDAKSGIPEDEKIKILNLITTVMESWRQNRSKRSSLKQYPDIKFVEIHELGL